jgi:prenyltransferase beta subunit
MIEAFKKNMEKKKKTFIAIIIIFFVGVIFNIQTVLGESRNTLIFNFIKENQNFDGGFYEFSTFLTEDQDPTLEATRASLNVLEALNRWDDIDKEDIKTWIVPKITSIIDSENNSRMYSLALESLDLVDGLEDLGIEPSSQIEAFLETLKIELDNDTIGYALTEGLNASVFGCYFVLSSYFYLANSSSILIINEIDRAEVSNFILSCLDSSGGFKSEPSEESAPSLVSTFYALHALELLGNLDTDIESVKMEIEEYINSFYVSDENSNEFGSYSFTKEGSIPIGSIYASHIALSSLSLIEDEKPTDATVDWILSHQNNIDGGFSEVLLENGVSNSSSITSYYAVEILKLKDPNLLMLNVEMYGTIINWGLILGITIPAIALIIGGIVFYKRKTAL